MKGVNKLVMEVRPDGEYFEKALLFIRPDKQNSAQKEITDNADKLLSGISLSEINRKSKKTEPILLVSAGILTGSFITAAALFLTGLL